MRIGIIGNGVVGNATARCFMEHAEIRVWDKVSERRTHPLVAGPQQPCVMDCDIVFVCVPETSLDELFYELLHMRNIYVDRAQEKNLVIKSTCPIGTTRRLAEKHQLKNLVHSPEFLTARCAVTDAQLPARNIIGAPKGEPNSCDAALCELYLNRFPGVQILRMSSDESEAVKLMQNSFFAIKIATFNEFYQLAKRLNLDWDAVLHGILSDGRIAHSHTKVPGPDGKFGFGGTCLPKDILQLYKQYIGSDIDDVHSTTASMLATAIQRNDYDRKRR